MSICKKYIRLFSLFCLAILISNNSSYAEIESAVEAASPYVEFKSKDLNFDYPKHYSRISAEELKNVIGTIPVVFATRSILGDRTFNLIAQTGAFEIEKDLISQVNRLVKDYKAVGIVDVAASTPQKIKTLVGEVFNAELYYSNKGQQFVSNVTVIPAGDRHYILTFVSSNVKNAQALKDDLQVILKSINSGSSQIIKEKTLKIIDSKSYPREEVISAESHKKQSLIAYVFCFLVIAVACMLGKKEKESSE